MNGWFGPPWNLLACEPADEIPVPVGEACHHCGEAFQPGDQGIANPGPRHHECFMRSITGGANHIIGRCTCCGGNQPPDPPGLTRREAALLAC